MTNLQFWWREGGARLLRAQALDAFRTAFSALARTPAAPPLRMSVPGRENRGQEFAILEPSVLEAEEVRLGDGGADHEQDWGVVRGRFGEGGERGVGEAQAHGVKEHAVKARKGGGGTVVGPGEKAIQERDVNKTEIVNRIVKGLGKRLVERSIVVFVARSR